MTKTTPRLKELDMIKLNHIRSALTEIQNIDMGMTEVITGTHPMFTDEVLTLVIDNSSGGGVLIRN